MAWLCWRLNGRLNEELVFCAENSSKGALNQAVVVLFNSGFVFILFLSFRTFALSFYRSYYLSPFSCSCSLPCQPFTNPFSVSYAALRPHPNPLQTPSYKLHIASQKGHLAVVDRLIAAQADVNTKLAVFTLSLSSPVSFSFFFSLLHAYTYTHLLNILHNLSIQQILRLCRYWNYSTVWSWDHIKYHAILNMILMFSSGSFYDMLLAELDFFLF